MKKLKKIALLLISILLITGCGQTDSENEKETKLAARDENTSNSVDIAETSVENTADNVDTYEKSVETTSDSSSVAEKGTYTENDIDYDLTQMSSDVIYATVYQMMMYPDEYEGKIFRVDGNFYAIYDETKDKYYYYCIIKDAAACCAQGLEFVLDEGTPDFLEHDEKITIQGTFETYTEEGDSNLYCRLKDATLMKE